MPQVTDLVAGVCADTAKRGMSCCGAAVPRYATVDGMPESQNHQESQTGQEITVREAAKMLRVSRSTAYRHAHRLGRRVCGGWRIDLALVRAELTGGAR